jgi:hypothetical protein
LSGTGHGRPIDKLRLAHARRAVEKMREGEVACALMHLPLAGLGELSQPREAAWRLLAAEGLMGSGVDPCMILRALTLDNPLDASRSRNQDCCGAVGSATARCA